MDTVEFKNLKTWVEAQAKRANGLTVAFSGSYSSAVTLALLLKSDLKVPLQLVYVGVKDELWRTAMAEQWLQTLRCPLPLRKIILNEVVDDLEDQVPNLKAERFGMTPLLVGMGVEAVARVNKHAIVWCGDRNAFAFNPPNPSLLTLCPLAHLDAGGVEALAKIVGLPDAWLSAWGDFPQGSWTAHREAYRHFDVMVGVALAHLEHARQESDLQSFTWMGWSLREGRDRLVLLDALRRLLAREHGQLALVDRVVGVDPWGTGYTVQDTLPPSYSILGSVDFKADASPMETRLLVRGCTVQGRRVDLGVVLPTSGIPRLRERLRDADQLLLPLQLGDEAEGDPHDRVVLSLSKRSIEGLKTALEDAADYTSILPSEQEIITRPLTEAELEARKRQREAMARAPRPPASKRF